MSIYLKSWNTFSRIKWWFELNVFFRMFFLHYIWLIYFSITAVFQCSLWSYDLRLVINSRLFLDFNCVHISFVISCLFLLSFHLLGGRDGRCEELNKSGSRHTLRQNAAKSDGSRTDNMQSFRETTTKETGTHPRFKFLVSEGSNHIQRIGNAK